MVVIKDECTKCDHRVVCKYTAQMRDYIDKITNADGTGGVTDNKNVFLARIECRHHFPLASVAAVFNQRDSENLKGS